MRPGLQLWRLLLEPLRDTAGCAADRQTHRRHRRDRAQRDLRRAQRPGDGRTGDRPQYQTDARVHRASDLPLRLAAGHGPDSPELENRACSDGARQLERRSGPQSDGPHLQGRRERHGARPRGQVRVRPAAHRVVRAAVPQSRRQGRRQAGVPAGLRHPGGGGSRGLVARRVRARARSGAEATAAGAGPMGNDHAGVRRVPAATRELRRSRSAADRRVGDSLVAGALCLERQRARHPRRRKDPIGRDARGRGLQERGDVRPRRPAGVQRARDGDGGHGPRSEDVGAQRAQSDSRRAQPVRHRRRMHGELVLCESVAYLHGPHRARGGLRGRRAHARQPVSTRATQAQVAATSFFALFAIVGLALYGLPFFYDFMVRDFGWSRAQVTSGNAISKLIVGPLFGFFAGWLVDRFGPRRLMVVGILMAGIALVGLGMIRTLAGFYLFYLFNALGNVCGGPLPNQVLLSRWFTAARGRAMGFAYLGIGIGGALVPFLAVWLTGAVGWQGALQVIGALIILVALPLALVVREAPDQTSPTSTNLHQPSVGPVLHRPAFYLLLVGSMCSIAAVGGTNQHLKLFLSLDHGFTQAAAARIASLVLASSLVGRLGMGWLADRFPKKYVMLLIYLLVASAIPLLSLVGARGAGAIYLFAVIFGIGLGGEYMVIPLMAAELFGVRVLGRAMGVVLAADGVAEAVAPVLVGRMRDVTGSYATGFLAVIGFALAGAVAISFLPRTSRPVPAFVGAQHAAPLPEG